MATSCAHGRLYVRSGILCTQCPVGSSLLAGAALPRFGPCCFLLVGGPRWAALVWGLRAF
eukprot:8974682-Alexandrium_andersonii.AAC.1